MYLNKLKINNVLLIDNNILNPNHLYLLNINESYTYTIYEKNCFLNIIILNNIINKKKIIINIKKIKNIKKI